SCSIPTAPTAPCATCAGGAQTNTCPRPSRPSPWPRGPPDTAPRPPTCWKNSSPSSAPHRSPGCSATSSAPTPASGAHATTPPSTEKGTPIMGYYIDGYGELTIKADNTAAAYQAVCRLNADDSIKNGGQYPATQTKPADSRSLGNP